MASESLKAIMEEVHQQRVVLPEFQRDFVWQPSAVIKLMASIFNGYPIGSFLLMENPGSYQFRPIEGVNSLLDASELETVLVLDGQQRLTSCYRAFYGTLDATVRLPGRYYFQYGAFVDAVKRGEDIEGSAIQDFFSFERPIRVSRNLDTTSKEMTYGMFPLDIIFRSPRGSSYVKWLNDYSFSESKGDHNTFANLSEIASLFQTRFIERVTGYQVHYEKITRDTNPDVICTIFETINTTGVKLTVFDLLVAKCFKGDLRLRDKLEEAIQQYRWISHLDPDGAQIATIQLPRILSLLHNGLCKKAEILRLNADHVAAKWDQAVAALDKALRIMTTCFGAAKIDFIPSMDAVAAMAAIVANHRFHEERDLPKLERWYWCTSISQYLSGAPESKIERTLREWTRSEGWLDRDDSVPDVVRDFTFSKISLDEATKQTAVYKGCMALMMSKRPKDIGQKRVDLSSLPSSEIEDHHIYPQRYLHSHGIKGAKANGILNRMPVHSETNRRIGASAPETYAPDLGVLQAESPTSELAVFGIDLEILQKPFSKEVFDLFLTSRREQLYKIIAGAVGKEVSQLAPQDE